MSRSALLDGRALVLVVVLGGLFALESSTSLDATKIAYFLLAAAAVAGATATAPVWLSRTGTNSASPWLVAAASIAALLLVSVGVSWAHGTSMTSWLRDASAYALFGAAPILALACAYTASRRWLVMVLAVCGALASVSFAVAWIGRRDLADLPIDRIALPSEPLAAALLALATSLALARVPYRWWWAAIAGSVLGLFFVTGSRSTLLLLAVPIGIAILGGRPWRGAGSVLLTEIVIAAAVFLAGETGIAIANGNLSLFPQSPTGASSAQPSGTPAPDRLGERLSSVGSLITNPGSDLSIQERLTQTETAWQAFTSSPWLGVGPGYTFRWTNTSRTVVEAFTLDTPLVYLAKFGLLGLVPLALFVAAYLRLAVALWRRRQQAQIEYLSVVGFAIALAVVGVLNFPIEDKGASFAIILLLALGLHGLVDADSLSEPAGTSATAAWPREPRELGPTGR